MGVSGIVPISASLLSVVASIAATIITKKKTSNDKKSSKMSIKWKDKEIEIDNCSENEIIELITKLKDEEKLQENSACKKES